VRKMMSMQERRLLGEAQRRGAGAAYDYGHNNPRPARPGDGRGLGQGRLGSVFS
jgi:hypothetical protein